MRDSKLRGLKGFGSRDCPQVGIVEEHGLETLLDGDESHARLDQAGGASKAALPEAIDSGRILGDLFPGSRFL